MAREVMQDAFRGVHGVVGGTGHGAAQHSHRVCYVRPRLGSAVEQSANKGLICCAKRSVRQDPPSFRVQCVCDDKREICAGGCMVTLEGRRYPFGQICVDEL
eukprot:6176999-Pleurochrysis_carterae.AAC.2